MRSPTALVIAMLAVMLFQTASAASAAPLRGVPDTRLGPSGARLTHVVTGPNAASPRPVAVSVDSRGRTLLVGGRRSSGGSEMFVWRLLRSGAADRSFDRDGELRIPRGLEPERAFVDRQDRLVVTGEPATSGADGRTSAMRIGPRGRDASYGVNGTVVSAVQLGDAAMDAAGRLVFAGRDPSDSGRLLVARYDASGRSDATWGEAGRVSIAIPPNRYGEHVGTTDVAVLRDGSVLVASMAYRRDTLVVRLDPNGAPSTLLGPAGWRWLRPAWFMVARPDGRFLLRDVHAVHQFAADGTVDTGFGRSGSAAVPAGPSGAALAPVVRPDGSVLAPTTVHERADLPGMGRFGWDVALLRLRENGSRDPRFGARGVAAFRVPLNQTAGTQALAFRRDGTMVGAWKSARAGSESPNALRWLGLVVGGLR